MWSIHSAESNKDGYVDGGATSAVANGSFSNPAWMPCLGAIEIAGLGIRQQYRADLTMFWECQAGRRRDRVNPRAVVGEMRLLTMRAGEQSHCFYKIIDAFSGCLYPQTR